MPKFKATVRIEIEHGNEDFSSFEYNAYGNYPDDYRQFAAHAEKLAIGAVEEVVDTVRNKFEGAS